MNTHVPRRRARFLVLAAAGGILVLGLAVLALVGGILAVARTYTGSAAATAALAYAADCPPVAAVLGDHLTPGWAAEVELLGDVTTVRMPIQGPLRDGVTYIEMVPPYGPTDWRRIEVAADGFPPRALDDAFCAGATATTAADP